MGKLTENIVLDRKSSKRLPLYQQIREQIRRNITTQYITGREQLPSISYLAKKWNVTYRTIKAAYDLLEEDGLIRYDNQKTVKVNSLTQKPDGSDKTAKAFSLAYITCHHDDPYYALAYQGIRNFAIEKDLELMLIDVGASQKRFIDTVTNPGEGIDGLLILPFETPGFEEAVRKTIEAGKKVVFLDRFLPNIDASSVEADHFSIAYQATAHLITTHNRPVYYMAFVHSPSGARFWFKGWAAAMDTYGYVDCKPYVFDFPVPEERLADTVDIGLEYSVNAALDLFKSRREEKYCIFSGNDFFARGVYIAAEQLGLKIGKDVFVVGSNNMPFAERMPPPLSSVKTVPSTQDLGYQAAKLLYEHITGVIRHPVRRLLPVELVVRESSVGI